MSSSPSSSLPQPRVFLAQLFNALPVLPLPHQQHQSTVLGTGTSADITANTPTTNSGNILHSATEEDKKQFLTLHVLFPNEFLPALDLLDRRLVTRHRICRPQGEAAATAPHPSNNDDDEAQTGTRARNRPSSLTAPAAQDDRDEPYVDAEMGGTRAVVQGVMDESVQSSTAAPTTTTTNVDEILTKPRASAPEEEQVRGVRGEGGRENDTVYYVRSAQPQKPSRSFDPTPTTTYEVRLQAWNCSCPAFAFAAFPPVHPEPAVMSFDDNNDEGVDGEDAGAGWSFGGMSLGDGMPPVCKHLLACMLAERCPSFGAFVETREVSVKEAAGWAAGWGD
ncbi:hypothetical protein BU24DRAFT_422798 [Aaosphaeria arxii CBS 175.79]|uniref:SWIM-type domain-containing protein n=1 Tax=Aaosphaeria arxii CBS 175.79 TaxID=1450172 RepID=A0A6A5XW33_9PLEO|nr:uncharacterized protein BU24DRAFT_422798 [Aaosphaeria arxii CBS 175.79]KAF2016454.1 hypothetical protein BU24DRAFT_422798 [Aaosphaeria arxii CBS 175.79]